MKKTDMKLEGDVKIKIYRTNWSRTKSQNYLCNIKKGYKYSLKYVMHPPFLMHAVIYISSSDHPTVWFLPHTLYSDTPSRWSWLHNPQHHQPIFGSPLLSSFSCSLFLIHANSSLELRLWFWLWLHHSIISLSLDPHSFLVLLVVFPLSSISLGVQ